MNNINEFVIRDMSKETQTQSTFLYGKEAIIEYIRQMVKIEKNVLWWDYQFGLDVTTLNLNNVVFWLRKCLSKVPFIEELATVESFEVDKHLFIKFSIKFIDQSIEKGTIKIN